MPKPPTEGFVWTTHRGVKSWHFAHRHNAGLNKDRVARFDKSGVGMWCSSHVAKRFFEHPWKDIQSQDQIIEVWERAMKVLEEQAGLDRLISPHGWRDDQWNCKICGTLVLHQRKHFNWHQRMNLVDPAFHLTVDILFGNMAVATDAAQDAADLLHVFGVHNASS